MSKVIKVEYKANDSKPLTSLCSHFLVTEVEKTANSLEMFKWNKKWLLVFVTPYHLLITTTKIDLGCSKKYIEHH